MHCPISFYYVYYSLRHCSSQALPRVSPLYDSALLCAHCVLNVSLGRHVRHKEPCKMVKTKHSTVFTVGDSSLVAISLSAL